MRRRKKNQKSKATKSANPIKAGLTDNPTKIVLIKSCILNPDDWSCHWAATPNPSCDIPAPGANVATRNNFKVLDSTFANNSVPIGLNDYNNLINGAGWFVGAYELSTAKITYQENIAGKIKISTSQIYN